MKIIQLTHGVEFTFGSKDGSIVEVFTIPEGMSSKKFNQILPKLKQQIKDLVN